MSERPVADLDDVGDDSSSTASSDAADSGQQGGSGSEGGLGSASGGGASRDEEDLMPDLADNPGSGATESNPN